MGHGWKQGLRLQNSSPSAGSDPCLCTQQTEVPKLSYDKARIICPCEIFHLKLQIWRVNVSALAKCWIWRLTSGPLISEQKHVGNDSASPGSPPLSQSHCPLCPPNRLWPRGHPESVSAWSAGWRGSTQAGRTPHMCE